MIDLPELFLEEIRALLPADQVRAYLDSYSNAVHSGIRVNTLKRNVEDFAAKAPFELVPIPWTRNGFFFAENDEPTHHPWYTAGAYYVQEPSAMIPAQLLPVEPGDMVLDLCAAPGGKATELAARLQGRGFLLANDVSNSRAKALLRNLERFGVANMAVCSESSARLAELLPETFTKILVDAPCSGEGMFHKEPSMIADWLERGPDHYADLQKSIILDAADMLAPGGMMLYSTCTFSRKEDEGIIAWLLEQRSGFRVVPVPRYEGFAPGQHPCEEAVRVWPHYMKGEGHFACLLQKEGTAPQPKDPRHCAGFLDGAPEEAQDFLASLREPSCLSAHGMWKRVHDDVYFVPLSPLDQAKLRYLRTGLHVGTCKRGRFEPAQALAMALRPQEFPQVFDVPAADERIARYLRGETVQLQGAEEELTGWTLVCVDGLPLGWAKAQGGQLKNKLHPGWRI